VWITLSFSLFVGLSLVLPNVAPGRHKLKILKKDYQSIRTILSIQPSKQKKYSKSFTLKEIEEINLSTSSEKQISFSDLNTKAQGIPILTEQNSAPLARSDSTPFFKSWYFIGGVAAAALAGTLFILSNNNKSESDSHPPGSGLKIKLP